MECGLWFMVYGQGLGARVFGSEFGVQFIGSRVQGLEFRVQGSGSKRYI